MKEQICLPNKNNFECQLTLYSHECCAQIHICIISKVIGINKEKDICLPNKEYISCHRYEKTNMADKLKYLQIAVIYS